LDASVVKNNISSSNVLLEVLVLSEQINKTVRQLSTKVVSFTEERKQKKKREKKIEAHFGLQFTCSHGSHNTELIQDLYVSNVRKAP
jgi:hypothetical protein